MISFEKDCQALEILSKQHLLENAVSALADDNCRHPKDLSYGIVQLRNRLEKAEKRSTELAEMLAAVPEQEPDQLIKTLTGYESLSEVLTSALFQASDGKGKERHAREGEPFEKQKICEITRRSGLGFPIGQAAKKGYESLRLGDRGPAELLGAINYLAVAVIIMQEEYGETDNEK